MQGQKRVRDRQVGQDGRAWRETLNDKIMARAGFSKRKGLGDEGDEEMGRRGMEVDVERLTRVRLSRVPQ